LSFEINSYLESSMKVQMIISGVGGQGVLLLTRVFSEVALNDGYPIIGSEDHGMSQRGGSVITHLKIGDFDSPLVKKGNADILLTLEKNEAYKTLHYLKPSTEGQKGGLCFINAANPDFMDPQIGDYLEEKGIEVYVFGADRLAKEMGSVQSVNIAMIGFASAHRRFPFSQEKLKGAIERVTPPRFKDLSLRVYDRALSEGRKLIKS
jgi:indolepyruvate ferredoxin oxidoreductase beta subunit